MKAVILNAGASAWAFEPHAVNLAKLFSVEISEKPGDFNYVLGWDEKWPFPDRSFIPHQGIQIAADKRLQADLFKRYNVPTPRNILVDGVQELRDFLRAEKTQQWVLKYPTSCGASGHSLVTEDSLIQEDWPRPYLVQEFVPLMEPEVYRLYCVAGEVFGWNARRFPKGVKPSPWVAHARGARYVHFGKVPEAAAKAGKAALQSAGLIDSFGAVDLLPRNGEWLVLEIGTDGIHNHVDRDFDNLDLKHELEERLKTAFWKAV